MKRLMLAMVTVSILSLVSCGTERIAAPNPAVVIAHSEGIVSRGAVLSVVLSTARESASLAGKNPFRIEPPVPGTVTWSEDGTRADFKPNLPLAAGQAYRIVFDFSRIGEASNGWFSFNVQAEKPGISFVSEPSLSAGKNGGLSLSGIVRARDVSSSADVENYLSARFAGEKLSVSWSHPGNGLHHFLIKDIIQQEKSSALTLSWNGRSFGSREKGDKKIRVPALGSFEVLSVQGPVSEGSRALTVAFSAPVDPSQDLRGLIRSSAGDDLNYEVDGGLVRVYANFSWPEKVDVVVDKGVRSSSLQSLMVPVRASVAFDWEKPQVRFVPGGSIVPSTQGTRVVLETMNLTKVYIEALRVYGDNMLQFLQVNEMNGSDELKRVGEVVWSSTLDLGWTDDKKNQWVPFALDLSSLLAKHPDGMFQLRVTFGHDFIRYVCPNSHTSLGKWKYPPIAIADRGDSEDSYWDWYEEWFDWDEYYKYREDPCHPAYYITRDGNDKSARRNVLVSDVGLMAKRDVDGAWHVSASDMRSARPLAGATAAFYSFAKKELGRSVVAANGIAVFKPAQGTEPYFVVVSPPAGTTPDKSAMAREKGYLKLSQELAVSHFDIGGEASENGLKGFIYGERGVWRPGDDIHLVFVLYDRLQTLPANHPISFEFENPLGQVVRSATYTNPVNGFYYIKTTTEASSPTGTWTARVRVGGKTMTKSVKVETVMPNRLKMTLDYGKKPWISADTDSMGITAQWLHGAPAPGLKTDVSLLLSESSEGFGSFKGYTFIDPTRSAPSERQLLYEGFLDETGAADFSVNLSSENESPGPLTATLLSRVFEQSGLFSSEIFSVPFHPYARYVGFKLPEGDKARGMLLTDTDHRVEIAMVDRDGNPVPDGKARITLYKMQWRWWWEKGEESLAEQAGDMYERTLASSSVAIKNGRAIWTLNVKYPEWGRYFIRVSDENGGHAAGQVFYMDWPGWAGKGRADAGGSSLMLSLSADKEKYAVGDPVRISFPSNKEGRAMVSVERAGRIVREEWVEAKDGTTVYEFKAGEEMAPNVYVHVSFIQAHLQTANDLPIRLYGTIPVMVENPQTRLEPSFDLPPSLEPSAKSAFTVFEKNGKPMTYTVAVVDEGLLGITRYVTPNPWNEFYKKEASLLKHYDLYKDVAGAYSGKLQTLLSIGGSEFGDAGGNRKVARFPPIVKFYGPFSLAKGERRTHELELGPYVGAVRFMIVAGTPAGAYGKTEAEVKVRSDLMTFITAPRVLGPGEKVTIPVSVFGFLGKNSQATLTLKVDGAADIVGPAVKTVLFPEDGEQSSSFQMAVRDEIGAVRISASATAPNGKTSVQTIEIPVRSSAIPVTVVQSQLVAGNSAATIVSELPGLPGSNQAWLELSLLPPIDLSSRLGYLIGYPHGCGEQTTSKAFPQLFLADSVALNPEQAEAVRVNVTAGIAKIKEFQTARGGFVFWPGEYEENQWLSAYISHFLVMAKRQGYTVPEATLQDALAYLRAQTGIWSSREDYSRAEQAYRLYVLALAGKPDVPSMNRFMEYGTPQPSAVYQLAAAYALAGMREKAVSLLGNTSSGIKAYPGIDRVYGSVLRDKALILDALNALGDTSRGLPVFKQIAEELSSGKDYSTQSLSYALIACLPYMKASGGQEASVSYSYNRGEETVAIGKTMARIPLSVSIGALSLKLANKSAAAIYARVVSSGVPRPGKEKIRANGLSLTAVYMDSSENEVNPDKVLLGQDILVDIEVSNRTGDNLSDIALTFRAPSGWELSNPRIGRTSTDDSEEESSEDTGPDSAYSYRDIRDDRVMTYFALARGETRRFRMYANKTYAGEFFLPAITAEAMYLPEIQAVIPGRQLSAVGTTAVPSKSIAPRGAQK